MQEELENISWRVVGLSEVRRKGEGCVRLENGDDLYYNGGEGIVGGTGFLVNSRFNDQRVLKWECFSPRISCLILLINNCKINLIQVYAPTSASTDEENEVFYTNLQDAVDSSGELGRKFCIGDFNSKVGKRRLERSVGAYGYDERNERGERLVEFAEGNNFRIMNTFFQCGDEEKWTWISPDGMVRNEIDYILASRWDEIDKVEVVKDVDIGSDHRPLGVRLKWKKRTTNLKIRQDRIKLKSKELEEKGFENLLKAKINECETKIENLNKGLRETTLEVERLTNNRFQNCRKLPNHIKRLLEKRRKLKRTAINKIEYVEICKLVRKEMKEWLEERKIRKVVDALEYGGKLKPREQTKTVIVGLYDKEGNEIRDKDKILYRVKEYYEELYKGISVEEEVAWRIENSEEWVDITKDEVRKAIKDTKEGKAEGLDKISMGMIKAGGETVVDYLTGIYNECMREGKLKERWNVAKLVLLFKKGDKRDLKNYRPLSLLSVEYKILSKIITKRLKRHFDEFLSIDQAGFRANFSTIDHIFVLNDLLRKAEEYNFSLFYLFIDFEKAFDLVSSKKVIQMLRQRGVDSNTISFLEDVYGRSVMEFELEEGHKIDIKVCSGVKQGDVISPALFIGLLQMIMNEIEWGECGININGVHLNKLEFADDVVLVGKSKNELIRMADKLVDKCAKFGMRVNADKCRWMGIGEDIEDKLMIRGETVQREKHFIYLGQLLSVEGQWPEICRRCAIGWSAITKNRSVFRAGVNIEYKRKLWEMTILPTITYGCETWIMSERVKNKLRVTERAMERYLIGKTRKDRVRNEIVRSMTGFKDIVKVIMKRKWKWAGHIARSKDDRWSKRVMEWYPRNNKRNRGRPKDKWDKEMSLVCGGVTWRRVAQERGEWRRMGKVYREIWIDRKNE